MFVFGEKGKLEDLGKNLLGREENQHTQPAFSFITGIVPRPHSLTMSALTV